MQSDSRHNGTRACTTWLDHTYLASLGLGLGLNGTDTFLHVSCKCSLAIVTIVAIFTDEGPKKEKHDQNFKSNKIEAFSLLISSVATIVI